MRYSSNSKTRGLSLTWGRGSRYLSSNWIQLIHQCRLFNREFQLKRLLKRFGLSRLYRRVWMMPGICFKTQCNLWCKAEEGMANKTWVPKINSRSSCRDTKTLSTNTRTLLSKCTKILTWSMKPLDGIKMLELRLCPHSNTKKLDKKFTGISLGKCSMRSTNTTTLKSSLISTASRWRRLWLLSSRSFLTLQSWCNNSTAVKTTFTTFCPLSCIWRTLLTNMMGDRRSKTRLWTWFRTSWT